MRCSNGVKLMAYSCDCRGPPVTVEFLPWCLTTACPSISLARPHRLPYACTVPGAHLLSDVQGGCRTMLPIQFSGHLSKAGIQQAGKKQGMCMLRAPSRH